MSEAEGSLAAGGASEGGHAPADADIGDVRVAAGGSEAMSTQEFSFGRIYSAGEFFNVDDVLGLDEDLSLLSPHDDWDVLGDFGKEGAAGQQAEDAGGPAGVSDVETLADDGTTSKGKSVVESPSDDFPPSLMLEGEDAILAWFKKKNLMFVLNPAPVVAGEKDSDAYTRQMMQLSSEDRVTEMWQKNLRAWGASLVVDPPTSIADMMVVADGYQYGFPQQRILEMMRSEHCNHVLYQFFKAKSLKMEAKLRHRERALSAVEVEIEE
ncbi:uncharacterized protein LOC113274392 [Papaver somniferum]|uniref:uncharacterized protein LOC113274392 n=1 Tax=Papaver somniferum TaxID=3469 RepID=UPI000E6FF07B|nr:uncharacterized protein LOC113274392 [Papaver somniferum]